MFKIYDGRNEFFQWDLDRKIIVSDPTINEVHFCNKTDDCSLVVEVYELEGQRVADVPNILLQNSWDIRVYGYCGACYTKQFARFKVNPRSKPADYIYTETEIKTWEDLSRRVDEIEANGVSEEAIEQAINNYLEENPITGGGGATEEQLAQIEENAADIDALFEIVGEKANVVYVDDMAGGLSEQIEAIALDNTQGIAEALAAAKKYTDEEIAAFDFIKIVNELPTEGLPNRLYLVPQAGKESPDLFIEYLWVNKGTEEEPVWVWEYSGTQGATVELTDYVKNTDYAKGGRLEATTEAGLLNLKAWGNGGLFVASDNTLVVYKASQDEIDQRTSTDYFDNNPSGAKHCKPITPGNLDYAVRSVFSNKNTLWDDEDKAAVRAWLGIE